MRLIIVDDSPIARIMLKEMLESMGHQIVAETETLAETLKAYQDHKPDGVTLDLSLLNESGLDVLKALRKLDGAARVVIISGNSQKKVVEQILAAGAAGFLAKPFNIEELVAAVARLASR